MKRLGTDYRLVDKDPVIDQMRSLISHSDASYKKLADQASISPSTISAWFRGTTKRPQVPTVRRFCQAVGARLEINYDDHRAKNRPEIGVVETIPFSVKLDKQRKMVVMNARIETMKVTTHAVASVVVPRVKIKT